MLGGLAKFGKDYQKKRRQRKQNQINNFLLLIFYIMNEKEVSTYFKYEHLPAHLQQISKPFGELAKNLSENLNEGIQKDAALQKLLEAKDAAVRSGLKTN